MHLAGIRILLTDPESPAYRIDDLARVLMELQASKLLLGDLPMGLA